ncbi:UNVERIFIED_ORG: hypothetical protein FNL38_10891 [Nocardia globerula]|uniref:DUF1542 domain-containing protein n=2 Tax=Nocardiaceae TaxID=85025 RepID=A0A652YJ32_NOCGL|nr:hypothetical protein C8E04_3859 [Rhodococcus globerulus]
MTTILLILVVLAVVVFLVMKSQQRGSTHSATQLDDAKADARQAIERLGGQVYNLTGSDEPSRQALADAAERYTAAGSQIDQAATPVQARLAKQTALEGLYYIRAARVAMGMDPGPDVPTIDGQKAAGAVTESREVEFEGRKVAASPTPSSRTPNYYPGGRVAGRPVPAGWYSEPWWKPALVAGAWGLGSMMLFSTMFSGMAGVPYGAEAFAAGGDTDADQGADAGDQSQGDAGDQSYDQGDQGYDSGDSGFGDSGFGDSGFGDGGGMDFGGMDF